MKKTMAMSAIVLSAMFLAGCGQQPVSQTQPTTPAPVAMPAADNQPAVTQPDDSCRTLGQPTKETTKNGPPMTDLDSCCNGLVPTFSLSDFDSNCKNTYMEQGMSGATSYLCLACGDKTCDKKYENKCNCPEDCK